jgi:hypothetical protein
MPLRRATQGSLNNPVAAAGGVADEKLNELIERARVAILVSILNLDVFRDAYGFVASDDVLVRHQPDDP